MLQWLSRTAEEDTDSRLTVFAAAKFLGLLRGQHGNKSVEMREGELRHLRANELAQHPAVLEALKHAV